MIGLYFFFFDFYDGIEPDAPFIENVVRIRR